MTAACTAHDAAETMQLHVVGGHGRMACHVDITRFHATQPQRIYTLACTVTPSLLPTLEVAVHVPVQVGRALRHAQPSQRGLHR